MLGRVVDDVARPEEAALVRDAVEPVVGEVVGEEEKDPDPPVAGVEAKRRQLVKRDVRGEDGELPDEVDRDVPEPHRERGLRVARLEADQVVVVVVAEVAVRQILQREEQQRRTESRSRGPPPRPENGTGGSGPGVPVVPTLIGKAA